MVSLIVERNVFIIYYFFEFECCQFDILWQTHKNNSILTLKKTKSDWNITKIIKVEKSIEQEQYSGLKKEPMMSQQPCISESADSHYGMGHT